MAIYQVSLNFLLTVFGYNLLTFYVLYNMLLSVRDFYDISNSLDPRCLLVRCHEGKKKNIYFTSLAIRDIVISNENKVKMINTGVKTFVRCDNKNMKCAFRLAQEGMPSIIHYISDNRKLHVTKEDLIMLLQNNDPHTPPEIVKLNLDTQERLKDFGKYNNDFFYSYTFILLEKDIFMFNLSDRKLYIIIQRRKD